MKATVMWVGRFKKTPGQDVRNLIIDLVKPGAVEIDKQRTAASPVLAERGAPDVIAVLRCRFCRQFTEVSEANLSEPTEHKPGCAFQRAVRYLAKTEGGQ